MIRSAQRSQQDLSGFRRYVAVWPSISGFPSLLYRHRHHYLSLGRHCRHHRSGAVSSPRFLLLRNLSLTIAAFFSRNGNIFILCRLPLIIVCYIIICCLPRYLYLLHHHAIIFNDDLFFCAFIFALWPVLSSPSPSPFTCFSSFACHRRHHHHRRCFRVVFQP